MKKAKRFSVKSLAAGIGISAIFILTACGGTNNNEEVDNSTIENSEVQENESNSANTENAEEDVPEVAEGPDSYPQFEEGVAEDEREAIIQTNMGEIHIKLFPEVAPKAVENFLTLGEEGYYDGVVFHRVIEDFMIQGGDPQGTGMGGESIYDGPFEDEFDASVAHFNGALSMANSGPNTNGSQFFIVTAKEDGLSEEMFADSGFPRETIDKYLEVGGTPHLDFVHTVFGQVIDGMDVVEEINQVETEGQDRPVEDVVIESVEVLD
ncbi:peptidylprolyl isomerase [Salipaludibacillus neizhouensis]|uniref:Peptidyl-prolyl cis-trans isomerase n=1 Tax=Salipaludibacillus neizhouensis TaxID=885475 RepID=A0A3A9K863_9BACI|nr:peptidylprolyl isomerase [Salipaludibacillus neizhouensis]RKL69184.1 peptidylprolyl isomerase [Salipaludibacillus neizhouensis]